MGLSYPALALPFSLSLYILYICSINIMLMLRLWASLYVCARALSKWKLVKINNARLHLIGIGFLLSLLSPLWDWQRRRDKADVSQFSLGQGFSSVSLSLSLLLVSSSTSRTEWRVHKTTTTMLRRTKMRKRDTQTERRRRRRRRSIKTLGFWSIPLNGRLHSWCAQKTRYRKR